MDYSFYYRSELKQEQDWGKWDLFLSAYNLSQRLEKVFDKVSAEDKFWLIFPEYDFTAEELPVFANKIIVTGKNEIEQQKSILADLDLSSFKDKTVCIDATGFMRPQLLFMLFYFNVLGFKKVDFLYSEPNTYQKRGDTKFAYGSVVETRQISGFSGVNNTVDGRDLLIIAAGYDSNLIGKVAQYKENAEIVQIFGFPSLRPDMYQENILRTVASADSITGNSVKDKLFAPASDPFETASIIKNYIALNNCFSKYRHIYISPLSTKAQTLGIGLVFLNEYKEKPLSIIYPFTEKYSKETSLGLVKMWKYTLEFNC